MKGLLFVYLMTYGGVVASIYRPFYGLLVYMCFAILRPDHLWAWSLPDDGSFSKVIGIGLLVGWALHGFGDWNFRAAKPVFVLLIAYWLCIIVSATTASNQQVAWEYVVLHTKIQLPVLVGMTLIRSFHQVKQLIWALVGCLGFLAYEAHSMYFNGYLAEFRDTGMLGMDNNSVCIAMATGAGMAMILGFSSKNLIAKLVAFGLAALMVHVPMFGNSRGGMLGIAIVGIIAFVVLPKRPSVLLTYVVGLIVAIRMAGESVVERFSTIFADSGSRDASAQSRVDLWKDCWDVMTQHPVLGIGPDHWPLIAHHYGWPAGKEAHSLWMNCGAELGFVGLSLLLGLYLTTLRMSWKHLTGCIHLPVEQRDIGRAVIVALCGFMVSASFVSLDALELPFYVVLIGFGGLKFIDVVQIDNLEAQAC